MGTLTPIKMGATSPSPPPPHTPRSSSSSQPQPRPYSQSQSLFTPSETEGARYFLIAVGMFEALKLWDAIYPFFSSNPTNVSLLSRIRVSGPFTFLLWIGMEFLYIGACLRAWKRPLVSIRQAVVLIALLLVWNLIFWFFADPFIFIPRVSVFGPVHVGEEGFFIGWLFLFKHLVSHTIFGEPDHLAGKHTIRLLPYSTATLNPLSVTYCIPPESRQTLYVPIVFNNSLPDTVYYSVRSLETGLQENKSIPLISLKPPSASLQITSSETEDQDDEESVEPLVSDPLSALTFRQQAVALSSSLQGGQESVKIHHSIRPAESLAIVPQHLSSSQSIRFIPVEKPGVVLTIRHAVDNRGGKFHITPQREAVIIECPTGGDFLIDQKGKGRTGKVVEVRPKERQPETRCVGDEELVEFQARGVAPLKVGWRKRGETGFLEHGVIEGIEDESILPFENDHHHPMTDSGIRRDRIAKSLNAPLRVIHNRPGQYTLALTSVVDALHNSYTPSGPSSERIFRVLPRRSVSLFCPKPELLVNASTTLVVRADGPVEQPLKVMYTFTSNDGKVEEKEVMVSKNQEAITVSKPGTYTLVDLDGLCSGSVLEPSSCSIHLVPPPTAERSVTTLHECAMDVGVIVSFDFTGTPPFTVRWTEKRKGSREETRQRRFDLQDGHAQLELRPEKEGEYTYVFTTLSDAKYKNLPLNQPPIHQVVHPPAKVDIPGGAAALKRSLHSCSPNEIQIELEVDGIEPLKLMYRTAWGSQSRNVTIPIKSGKPKITVPIPPELAADTGATGKLSVSMLSIEDGNGCVRRLPPRAVEVHINRQKPTARFTKYDDQVIKEGQVVEKAVQLTGEGPWELTYSLDGQIQRPITIRSSISHVQFSRKGTYQLVQIRDAHCTGMVNEGTFSIDFKPKPQVELVLSDAISEDGNVYRHRGLCAGDEDQIALQFKGRSPFMLEYKYWLDSKSSKDDILKSVQETGVLHLASEPGSHRYQFRTIGDLDYDLSDRIPVSITLEHDVYQRPFAEFSKKNTRTLCLDSLLKTDARIKLFGKPPFILTVSTRKPTSASPLSINQIKVDKNEWLVELPEIIVTEVGSYEISIVDLIDSSGCDRIDNDPSKLILATTVEVLESARVVPVSQEIDLCVGDTLDFLLQGKSPWIVNYEWSNKTHSVTSSVSRFSRVADEQGTFIVRSVALKDKSGHSQCQREVNISRRIHPLPSVRIQDGLDDLREGDEPAVFGVKFTGTPPFTFTYTRSEQIGSRSRVVDTQTVTDIWDYSYTISSTLPGDYEVTSVSDKYCRYPPLSRSRSEK